MLNPFPIQFLAVLAYAVLRLFVGATLVYLGTRHIQKRHDLKHTLTFSLFPYGLMTAWYFALVELVIGMMFIAGFYTQIAALLAFILSLKILVLQKHFASPYIPGRLFYILLMAASISLFITGAGTFAFDLPI